MGLLKKLKNAVKSVAKAVLPVISPVTALQVAVGKLIINTFKPPASRQPGYIPGPWKVPATDAQVVEIIADVMQKPPFVTDDYNKRCVFVADYLKVGRSKVQPKPMPASLPERMRGKTWLGKTSRITPSFGIGTGLWGGVQQPISLENESLVASAASSKSAVYELIERVSDFSGLARKAGFDPPDNPFNAIATLNANRKPPFCPINLDEKYAADLIFNIKAYIDLLDAYNQGAINLTNGTINVAQLSHVKLSFAGIGGSGNTAADIKSFLPSQDAHKKEAARKALEALDFSKRVPYLLFALDYTPEIDGSSKGNIVGWKRIPDASGYIIKRRAVFSGEEREIEVLTVDVQKQTQFLMSYLKTFAMTFLNTIDEKSVYAFVDEDIDDNEMYIYKINAFQIRSDAQPNIFTADSSPVQLTPNAQAQIERAIRDMSDWPDFIITGWNSAGEPIKDYKNFVESISPWPAFAQYIYGDSTYDWLLAAANIRASMNRKESKTATREFSYLNASSQTLFNAAKNGRLVKPADKGAIAKNIEDAVQKYGVSQVLQTLLDETGITYYFEGRDPAEDNVFHRAGQDPGVGNGGLFDAVAAAIDPETATLDLNHLSTNMSALLNQQTLDVSTRISGKVKGAVSNPTEVAIPDPNDSTNVAADGPLQFINKLGDLRDGVIDLTTFDGISKFMRAMRIMSDFGPGRKPPAQPPADVPKPPPPPPPPPPPEPEPEPTYYYDGGGG